MEISVNPSSSFNPKYHNKTVLSPGQCWFRGPVFLNRCFINWLTDHPKSHLEITLLIHPTKNKPLFDIFTASNWQQVHSRLRERRVSKNILSVRPTRNTPWYFPNEGLQNLGSADTQRNLRKRGTERVFRFCVDCQSVSGRGALPELFRKQIFPRNRV